MPLVDPEITQGAEQLEQAMVSRKRKLTQMEEDNDFAAGLVREALSQFYLPSNRLLTGIDDCPSLSLSMPQAPSMPTLDSLGPCALSASPKRQKMDHILDQTLSFSNMELSSLDLNQNQKEFEVIMDALRIGATQSCQNTGTIDSCGQAAMMMSGDNGSGFHSLVCTSLET
jgi:hypothetical protein